MTSKQDLLPFSRRMGAPQLEKPLFSVKLTYQGEELYLADPSATRAMVALMDMEAALGGAASHFGGPAAFAELMSASFALMFHQARKEGKGWDELFHFVNDAGHCENGLYALKANYKMAGLSLESLRSFRSLGSPLTGHGEVHMFPQGVLVSNGPLGSALPQAQGLCMADALVGRRRLTLTAISDGACMEGEAKEALAAIAGFASKGRMAPFVLVISDNNTKLSGRIDQDSYSMAPTFKSLSALGWDVIELEKAHDLKACVEALDKAFRRAWSDPEKPVAVHAHTIKGYGVKELEEAPNGGHGFPLKSTEALPHFLKEIYGTRDVPEAFQEWCEELIQKERNQKKKKNSSNGKVEKVQVGISKAMIQMREKGYPVVSVSADLQGSTGVNPFHKKYPQFSIDVGVAEANMISTAAGLSQSGFIPVVDTFAQFGVTKGALPLMMSLLSEAPVIAVFSHIGFQDAADGASHQALSYLAMTSSLPFTQVYVLSSSVEAESLLSQAIEAFAESRRKGEMPSSYIFFLGRETFPPVAAPDISYRLGRAQVIRKESNNDVVLAASGALLFQALKAAESLEKEGIKASVLSPSIINHPDVETFRPFLEEAQGRLVCIEDHQRLGGLGSLLLQALVERGVSVKAKVLGVPLCFGQSAYKAIDLYKKYGLDESGIVQAAKELLGK
ncbi:MAG: transketolase [Bdellovibrio sp.]|nr:MAG: transketolase [Bdellovibrio sp.]